MRDLNEPEEEVNGEEEEEEEEEGEEEVREVEEAVQEEGAALASSSDHSDYEDAEEEAGAENREEIRQRARDMIVETTQRMEEDGVIEEMAREHEEWEAGLEELAREHEEEEAHLEEMERVAREPLPMEEQQTLDRVEYDIAIPSQHSYLDMAMQRVEGYNYWLEGEKVNMYMIPLDVIVIPGQALPLRIRESTLQFSMVRALLDSRHNTFGAVNLPAEREQLLLGRSWSQCGVTVQIIEISDETPREIVLKCKGRQRFKTIATQRHANLTLHATVEILADHIPPRLYDPVGRLRDPFKNSSHPHWLYKLHDVYTIVEDIKREIKRGSPLVKLELSPIQPDMFSYWLISAMPFNFNQRVRMLREDNLMVRLRSQLIHLKDLNKFDYCCQYCGTTVISSHHLVSMSSDGPFFVNPHGFAFEIVTAYCVQNTMAIGTATEQDSWFPGYGWSYLRCIDCMCQLGWKFSASGEDTKPRVFYGVERKKVRVLRHSEIVEEESDIVP